METEIVKPSILELNSKRWIIRSKEKEDWIAKHASGTLRKAVELGFSWRSLYLEERICYEYGWEFKYLPRSRVSFGDAIIEGDNSSLTETCWHAERYKTLNPFPDSDYLEIKYIQLENCEGLGLILRTTSAPWVPSGHIIYALIAEYDTKNKQWLPAKNPF